MGFGFATTPERENTTRCQKHNKQTPDLPRRSVLDPADKPCERYRNQSQKLPLGVALDIVVLTPEPNPFLSVWIAHNAKDWGNALVASMADLAGKGFCGGQEGRY
jgi:hypothetical protein